jgi:tetratricopeptide (TPR) repeat protein
MFEMSLDGSRRVHGDDHRETRFKHCLFGLTLISQNRLDEAEVHLQIVLDDARRMLHRDHPEFYDAEGSMGLLRARQGRLAEAAEHWRRALDGRCRLRGATHPITVTTTRLLAVALSRNGQTEEAETVCGDRVEAWRTAYGTTPTQTLDAARALGSRIHGNLALACTERDARSWIDGSRGRTDLPETCLIYALDAVATIFRAAGYPEDALPLFEEAERVASGGGAVLEPAIRVRKAECLILLQRFDEAERALRDCRASLGATDPALEPVSIAIDAALKDLYAAQRAAQPDSAGGSFHP